MPWLPLFLHLPVLRGHLKSFVYNKRLRRIDGRWEESQNLPDNLTRVLGDVAFVKRKFCYWNSCRDASYVCSKRPNVYLREYFSTDNLSIVSSYALYLLRDNIVTASLKMHILNLVISEWGFAAAAAASNQCFSLHYSQVLNHVALGTQTFQCKPCLKQWTELSRGSDYRVA